MSDPKYEYFITQQKLHLENLENIRNFIFGDENNQPQVTYVPKMYEFDKLYTEMKEWIETSYFDDYED